jgi:hypothetical protein
MCNKNRLAAESTAAACVDPFPGLMHAPWGCHHIHQILQARQVTGRPADDDPICLIQDALEVEQALSALKLGKYLGVGQSHRIQERTCLDDIIHRASVAQADEVNLIVLRAEEQQQF